MPYASFPVIVANLTNSHSALTLVVPFVSALTLNTPKDLSSGGPATISWTNAAGDPSTFSLELVNTVFHNSYAIANNVVPSSGTISLQLPTVPPGYVVFQFLRN